MKSKTLRVIAIIWCLFIGIGAVGGAVMMFADPTGETTNMSGLIPGFQVLPFADALFQNLIFPGIALFIVNGLTQLITAALLIKRRAAGSKCALGCGVLLMLWITIQFFIYPFNWLSTSYFIFGLLEAVNALMLIKKERA